MLYIPAGGVGSARYLRGGQGFVRDVWPHRDGGEGGGDLHEDRPPAAGEHHHRPAAPFDGGELRRQGQGGLFRIGGKA